MKKKLIIITLMIALLLFAWLFFFRGVANSSGGVGGVVEMPFSILEMGKISVNENKEFQFFGRTIDQDGQPLGNVTLEVSYTKGAMLPPFLLEKDGFVTSDKNGFFSVKLVAHGVPSISNIKKEEYWKGENWRPIRFKQDDGKGKSKDNPYLVTLIKEVTDNYLLETSRLSNTRLYVEENDPDKLYYNIIGQRATRDKDKSGKYDFSCEATYIGQILTLKFKGVSKSDGFLISENNLLLESDLHQFTPELTISLAYAEEKKNHFYPQFKKYYYVYIKSRDLNIYTRAHLELRIKEESVSCEMNFATNPYGEIEFRTFDMKAMDSSIYTRIYYDYREMLKEGKLPKRTDLAGYLNMQSVKKEEPIEEPLVQVDEAKENPKNTEIVFYGKVTDSKGKAVPEAVVVSHIEYLDKSNQLKIKDKRVRVDKQGNFAFKGERGISIRVVDMFKFEYFRNRVVRGHLDAYLYGSQFQNAYKPDAKKPEVFQLENGTYGELSFSARLAGFTPIKKGAVNDFHVDVYRGSLIQKEYGDFLLQVDFKEEEPKVHLKSKTEDAEDGLILSSADHFPGIQKFTKTLDFALTPDKDEKKYTSQRYYLLVKNKVFDTFAKVRLDFRVNREEVLLSAVLAVNFFGEQKFDDFSKVAYTGKIFTYSASEIAFSYSQRNPKVQKTRDDMLHLINNIHRKPQFEVPPGIDRNLEFRIDEMRELLDFSIGGP